MVKVEDGVAGAAGGAGEEAAFTVAAPERPGRFVFASPHSGLVYPPDMEASPHLGEMGLRSAEDALVDKLIASAPARGAALITAAMGRAYVDLNRDAGDLDPELIDGLEAGAGSPRTAAGYGVIPRLSGEGRRLYDRRLSLEEAQTRIARVHQPYHAALSELMQRAHARHGSAVLVDWHSMPSQVTRSSPGARGVDVVLGDRHGSSCDPALTRRLRARFEALGWRVALNHPYAGGWTTQVWGRPQEGFHAIQIELDRGLYLDEATRLPNRGWSRCERGVAVVIADLLASDD